jgi:hypothetical protein
MRPMIGLLELDVTEAKRLLASYDPPLSFTAFVVASVARATANHPEVHAYRNWRGQLVTMTTWMWARWWRSRPPQGLFALPHVIHDADIRTVADLSGELRRVKREPSTSRSGQWLARAAPIGTRIPGAVRAMYALMARSIAVRQRVGTVAVTAVGMFAGGGGYGITPMSLTSLEVVVGGMTQRPRVIDGGVSVRDVLDLTLAISLTPGAVTISRRTSASLGCLLSGVPRHSTRSSSCWPHYLQRRSPAARLSHHPPLGHPRRLSVRPARR